MFCHDICSNGYHWDLSNGNMLNSFKILNIHKSSRCGYTFFHDIFINGYHKDLSNGNMVDSFIIPDIQHGWWILLRKYKFNHVICIRLFKTYNKIVCINICSFKRRAFQIILGIFIGRKPSMAWSKTPRA